VKRGGFRTLAAIFAAGLFGAVPASALAATPTPEIHHSPTPTIGTTPRPTPTLAPRPSPSVSPSPRPTPNETFAFKAAILAAIDRRLGTIRTLRATVVNAKALTDADRAALLAQLDLAAAGLTALAHAVSAETDPAALRRDAVAVVNDYRVDDLLGPKVHLVIAADTALDGAAHDVELTTRLLAAVTREKAAGRDTRVAEGLIADMRAHVVAAQTAAGGVPAGLLPLTAAGFPGNRPALATAHAAVQSAGSNLHAAAEDAHRAAESLNLLTVADLRASGIAMIAERLRTIESLTAQVRSSKSLTDDDRTHLLTLLSTDQSGLTALGRHIQADTDLKTLQADVKSIYTDYRIYALVVPKVELVIAADALTAGTARLDAAGQRIAELIAKANAAGRDTSIATVALAGVVSHDSGARARLAGVSADLLGLTTEGYPANSAALAADRNSIEAARSDLAAATRDARLALEALR